jgi:hypothetical protein
MAQIIGRVLCLVVFVIDGFAQQPDTSGGFIETIFQSKIGEAPRMGWFAPEYGFLALEAASKLTIYPPLGMPLSGKKKATITAAQVREVRDSYWEACEIRETDQVTAFDTGRETDAARALYTTKGLPGESRSGLISIPLDRTDLATVNRLLGWPLQGALRRDEALAVRPQSFWYSLHRLYKSTTGLLTQEAVVLHKPNGQIAAHELRKDIDTSDVCDGCSYAAYSSFRSGTYIPLNMFELPGFPYPLLLLDTSTVEGRALSLFTFTPEGKPADFRIYEYVVHCK